MGENRGVTLVCGTSSKLSVSGCLGENRGVTLVCATSLKLSVSGCLGLVFGCLGFGSLVLNSIAIACEPRAGIAFSK